MLRLAALLHDIGKPATRRLEPGGAVSFYHHDVVGAKLAKKRLTRAALRQGDRSTRSAASSSCTCGSSGTRTRSGPTRPCGATCATRATELERLHILTRADVTTRNRRKADRLGFAYDDLESRIRELQEQEELDAVRPDLDGEQVMRILGLRPGREVGEAMRFLLELRLDEGPLGEEEATRRLLEWWSGADRLRFACGSLALRSRFARSLALRSAHRVRPLRSRAAGTRATVDRKCHFRRRALSPPQR